MSVWQPSVTREKCVCRLLTVCLVCGGLTRTVVVKHEPETVCLQGKSWAFWNVLVTAVRHNFLLWRRVLYFSSSRHISHSFIAARLVFSLWVIWESLSVCVYIHKLSRTQSHQLWHLHEVANTEPCTTSWNDSFARARAAGTTGSSLEYLYRKYLYIVFNVQMYKKKEEKMKIFFRGGIFAFIWYWTKTTAFLLHCICHLLNQWAKLALCKCKN